MTAAPRLLDVLCSRLSTPLSAADGARPVARRAGQLVDEASFRRLAARWARAFMAVAGDSVALHFDDTLSFAAALFALWSVGKTAWLPGDLQPATVAALRGRVAALAHDGVGPSGVEAPPRVEAAAPDDRADAALRFEPLRAEAEQLVIFTSGSTGAPTALPKKLRQLFAEIDALDEAFGPRAGRAEVLGLVSHQHIYGLLFRVLWPLATGRVLHAERPPYVETLLEALPDAPAVVIASPAHLKRLPPAATLAPGRVALVFSSGGPLPDEAVPESVRLFGRAPIEVYGSSETGGVAWRQRDVSPAWTPLPRIDWRIASDGELLQIRSAHLPEVDAWFDSADRVRAAADGDGFELIGRADRIVKIEGKRVSLQTVEDQLRASGWISELRVIALPDERADAREQLAVVAQLNDAGWEQLERDGKPALARALRERLAPHVERIALPRRWRFVSALPANTQGKATLESLRRLFDARRPTVRELTRAIDEQGGHDLTLRLYVDAALPQFDGHFPGHPILPGVAQLDWVMQLAREHLPLTGEFQGLDGLKFQQVIRPGQSVDLRLSWRAPLLSFSYSSAAGPHAAGKVRFTPDQKDAA